MKYIYLFLFALFSNIHNQSFAQEIYFPDRNAQWEESSNLKIDEEALQKAVDFALANEYSGSRDLRPGHFERI